MDSAINEGLAAVIALDCNILILLTIMTIWRNDIKVESAHDFLVAINAIMDFLLFPLRFIFAKLFNTNRDLAPYLLLAILIPVWMFANGSLRMR